MNMKKNEFNPATIEATKALINYKNNPVEINKNIFDTSLEKAISMLSDNSEELAYCKALKSICYPPSLDNIKSFDFRNHLLYLNQVGYNTNIVMTIIDFYLKYNNWVNQLEDNKLPIGIVSEIDNYKKKVFLLNPDLYLEAKLKVKHYRKILPFYENSLASMDRELIKGVVSDPDNLILIVEIESLIHNSTQSLKEVSSHLNKISEEITKKNHVKQQYNYAATTKKDFLNHITISNKNTRHFKYDDFKSNTENAIFFKNKLLQNDYTKTNYKYNFSNNTDEIENDKGINGNYLQPNTTNQYNYKLNNFKTKESFDNNTPESRIAKIWKPLSFINNEFKDRNLSSINSNSNNFTQHENSELIKKLKLTQTLLEASKREISKLKNDLMIMDHATNNDEYNNVINKLTKEIELANQKILNITSELVLTERNLANLVDDNNNLQEIVKTSNAKRIEAMNENKALKLYLEKAEKLSEDLMLEKKQWSEQRADSLNKETKEEILKHINELNATQLKSEKVIDKLREENKMQLQIFDQQKKLFIDYGKELVKKYKVIKKLYDDKIREEKNFENIKKNYEQKLEEAVKSNKKKEEIIKILETENGKLNTKILIKNAKL